LGQSAEGLPRRSYGLVAAAERLGQVEAGQERRGALLNSRPVIEGIPRDALGDDAEGRRWLRTQGGRGSEGELRRSARGRLRACANLDCTLFLLDRSHADRARWCSMAICGNRMKARRHHRRTRATGE
jgi:hypothetical protein